MEAQEPRSVELSFLTREALEVREKRPNWRLFRQSHLITEEDLHLLTSLTDGTTSRNPPRVFECLVHLVTSIATVDAVKYLLVLIDDHLDGILNHDVAVASTLVGLLQRENLFISHYAFRILCRVVYLRSSGLPATDVILLIAFAKKGLSRQHTEYLETIAFGLHLLMRMPPLRQEFASRGGIMLLVEALAKPSAHYHLLFSLWTATFNPDCARIAIIRGAIPRLAEILSTTVVRLCVATLRNLLEKVSEAEQKTVAVKMVHSKVLKGLEFLESGRCKDDELVADGEFVVRHLQEIIASLTSLDVYVEELKSRVLVWSPAHRSAAFWRENAEAFSRCVLSLRRNVFSDGFLLVRQLLDIAEQSDDLVSRCVAANDLGELAKASELARHAMESIGAKDVIMRLLDAQSPHLRYYALVALQNFMVPNWCFIGRHSVVANAQSA